MTGSEVKTTLRLPAKLHEAISAAAEKDVRSFNNQVVYTLTQVFLPDTTDNLGKEKE